jgi:hypothetical protein
MDAWDIATAGLPRPNLWGILIILIIIISVSFLFWICTGTRPAFRRFREYRQRRLERKKWKRQFKKRK